MLKKTTKRSANGKARRTTATPVTFIANHALSLPTIKNTPSSISFKGGAELIDLQNYLIDQEVWDETLTEKHAFTKGLEALLPSSEDWDFSIKRVASFGDHLVDALDAVEISDLQIVYMLESDYTPFLIGDQLKKLQAAHPGAAPAILTFLRELIPVYIYTPADALNFCQENHWEGHDTFLEFKDSYSPKEFNEMFGDYYITDEDIISQVPEWSLKNLHPPVLIPELFQSQMNKLASIAAKLTKSNFFLPATFTFPSFTINFNERDFMSQALDEEYHHAQECGEAANINALICANLSKPAELVEDIKNIVALYNAVAEFLTDLEKYA